MSKNPENNKDNKIKSDKPKNTVGNEIALTIVVIAFMFAAIVAAADLIGLFVVPDPLATWVGMTLMAYVLVGFCTVVHTAVIHKTRKV
jgi:fatty acid desaturase